MSSSNTKCFNLPFELIEIIIKHDGLFTHNDTDIMNVTTVVKKHKFLYDNLNDINEPEITSTSNNKKYLSKHSLDNLDRICTFNNHLIFMSIVPIFKILNKKLNLFINKNIVRYKNFYTSVIHNNTFAKNSCASPNNTLQFLHIKYGFLYLFLYEFLYTYTINDTIASSILWE